MMSTRVHKVGSMTFGITLVAVGLAYLTHLFLPALTYIMIIRAWPIVFVLLGTEILLSNIKVREDVAFVYDKTAIFLTMMVVCFAMCMGALSMCFEKSIHITL